MGCNNCHSEEFEEVYADEYSGHKASGRNRNDTTKTIFVCEDCGGHGRKFVDGVDGGVQLSGVLRE